MEKRSTICAALAAGLGAVAALIALGYLWLQPTVLTVAVSAHDRTDQQLFAAFADLLRRDHASIYLRLVTVPDAEAVSAALDRGAADLVVAGPDASLPQAGNTVAILRREGLIVAVPSGSPITTGAEFAGRRIGVLRTSPAAPALANKALEHDGLAGGRVELVDVNKQTAVASLKAGRVDAIAVAGSLVSPRLRSEIAALFTGPDEPSFIGIDNSDAIAAGDPNFQTLEIGAGAIGSYPRRPEKPFKTLAAPTRLLARQDLSEDTVRDLTKRILTARLRLARQIPEAVAIVAPETDRAALVPVHPGTLALLNGEQTSFFSRWEDPLYFGLFCISGLGSTAAAVFGWSAGRERRRVLGQLEELRRLTAAIDLANEEGRLISLENDVACVIDGILASVGASQIGALDVNGFLLANQVFQQRLWQRRRCLTDHPGSSGIVPFPGHARAS